LIGFSCRVCDTRLHARPENVGRKVRCPDCGAGTIVPPPPKERPVRPPAAMDGEQYEVYPVGQQPTAAEVLASQPKLIGLDCSLCGTRLHASLDQVDELIACPDCGAKTRVPPYSEKLPAKPWREDDGEELDLEVVSTEHRPAPPLHGVSELADAHDDATASDAERETTDYTPRPKLARWPLQTGILLFPLSRGVPPRLILFAVWATFVVWLAYTAVGLVAGYGTIMAMFLLAASGILGTMCLAALAASLLAIVTESSEGNEVVEAWPDMVFLDWMFEGFYILTAGLVACIPGWAVSLLWPDEPLIRAAVIAGGAVVFFPIVLLSMLDIGSPLAPASPKIVASLLRAPGSWLMFLVESGLLVAALAAVGLALVQWSPLGLVFFAPVVVLASIWYFRLLGRLAWVLAEVMVTEE
jgi:DNA-directed RNA polymerase subunit RPC12/RpoP